VSTLILRGNGIGNSVVLLLAGLSIAPLFALERGNTDLFLFAVLFLGCMLSKPSQRSGVFLVATLLKLFPLVALVAEAIRERGKNRIWPASALVLAGVLLGAQWKDLLLIQKGTPITNSASYGILALRESLWVFLLGHAPWVRSTYYVVLCVMLSCWIAGVLIAAARWRRPAKHEPGVLQSQAGDLFLVFGAIYAATFAIGSNWDYRLIFLIPTLPLALELAKRPGHSRWGILYICSVLLAENCVAFGGGYKSMLAQAFTVTTFFLIVAMLVEQLRSYIGSATATEPVGAEAEVANVGSVA